MSIGKLFVAAFRSYCGNCGTGTEAGNEVAFVDTKLVCSDCYSALPSAVEDDATAGRGVVEGVVTAHSLMPDGKFTPLPGGVLDAGWTTVIDLPPDAHVCAVGILKNMPTLWESHNVTDGAGKEWAEALDILVVADGHPHEEVHYKRYLGTIPPPPGAINAYHVFTRATSGNSKGGVSQ